HPQQGRVGPYETGVFHAKGLRPTMEDEHVTASFTLDIQGKKYPIQLFGICDGHGGPDVSKFVKQHLASELSAALKEHNPNGLTDEGIWNAIKMACVSLDKKIPSNWAGQGSTGTFAMILDEKLWTGNVGDSRTVLDRAGTPVQLSEDAKPDDAAYEKGILNRDGVVVDGLPPRVNGILAVARAFGDHGLNGAVSARPKITMVPLKAIPKDSHLVLCCDGVWDIGSTAQVVKAVRANRNESPATLARNIVYSSLRAGSTDNLSAMVVKL
ncbi:MAG TPA: PP2C family protein-serine/threonine phosphatase, partial [Rhabdochlamydiaceae bacterium]